MVKCVRTRDGKESELACKGERDASNLGSNQCRRHGLRSKRRRGNKKNTKQGVFFGDPDGIRTHDTAVKGRCLNRLTTGPTATM